MRLRIYKFGGGKDRRSFSMKKSIFYTLKTAALALVVGLSLPGCVTQYNNLLQPTQELGTSGIDNYTVLGVVSIVSVGVGTLATPLSYDALLKKAKNIYGEDKVGRVVGVQINSYEEKLFGFISVSRKTEMAGIALQQAATAGE
jgi:hypothetical protein